MKIQHRGSLYDKLIKEYAAVAKANGKDVPIVTASTLVFLSSIPSGGTSSLKWGVLTSDNPILPQEIRLNINDEFVMAEIMVALYGPVGQATGPATNLSNRYWTYSPYQLGHTFVTLLPFWDTGVLSLQVNSTQIIKNWDTNQHNWVPRTQDNGFQAITTSGTPLPGTQGNADWAQNGFVECSPTITLSGAKTNALTLTFQSGNVVPVSNFLYLTSNDDDVYFSINTAAFITRGFLAQNAAQFQGSQNAHPQAMQHRTAHAEPAPRR